MEKNDEVEFYHIGEQRFTYINPNDRETITRDNFGLSIWNRTTNPNC
jgi:hypothetical protein